MQALYFMSAFSKRSGNPAGQRFEIHSQRGFMSLCHREVLFLLEMMILYGLPKYSQLLVQLRLGADLVLVQMKR